MMRDKLKEFQKKRLKQTPEPFTSQIVDDDRLHFSVQKHAARRLHYDLRLELDDVLLSWAVPKGPSMNPDDKRLAIHVEDHPLDYRTFEGVIPKGSYGAGTVELWDEGIYTSAYGTNKKESEKLLREGMKKGHLEFVLYGKKLKGRFSLIELKNSPQKDAWLLIKGREKDHPPKKKQKLPVKMPDWINPMLAKLIDAPFNDKNWLFEIKLDGYRVLSFVNGDKVQLYSRNKNSFNSRFPQIVEALKQLPNPAILDGEIVVLDKKGKSSFQNLANFQRKPTGELYYYIFDLLFYDGRDLRAEPLIERKEMLKHILKELNSPLVRYNDHVEEKGVDFFKKASKLKLEGIIGKNKSSSYLSKRSGEWVKIKTALRQEAVIGGFTKPKGGRKKFGALLLGVFKEGQLEYVGDVGGGFDSTSLEEVYHKMQPLIQDTCPFKTKPTSKEISAWVKPKLVCEVSFAEWTSDNKMRQPIFHGLRVDKPVIEVVKEVKEDVEFTNLDKLFWKDENYTKADLINYYKSVARYILPHLKDRALMMRRFPNGINAESFYQKNIEFPPSWMETAVIDHGSKQDRYVLVQDEKTLLYVANLGSIELHAMTSRFNTLNFPDYLVIDLDPESIPFQKVVEVALWIHDFLEELKVPNYCKTSGGRGLHIYIPLGAKFSFEQIEMFAELLAHIVKNHLPSLVSLQRMPEKRQKKVYFDYLQNAPGGRTTVSAYSVRAKPQAPVSTPLAWKEVTSTLDPLEFTIKTVPARLANTGDLFKPLLNQSINLKNTLKKLEKLKS